MSDQVVRNRIRRTAQAYPSLLKWRLALGLSQAEAAGILAISQAKYSRLERGVGVAVRDEARKIRARTGVPIEVLTGAA